MRAARCPQCSQEWSQRDARFCGSCGAVLEPGRGMARGGRRAKLIRTAVRLTGLLAGAGLVAVSASSDLAARGDGGTVRITDGATTSPTPLSDAEADELRLRSDPDRLRCEPRGCELWRIHRAGAAMATGAVQLDSGAIAVLIGPQRIGDGAPQDADAQDHRLLALDPVTGDEQWSRPVSDYSSVSGAYGWVRLVNGVDGGGLIIAGSTVTAFDGRGEQLWVGRSGGAGGAIREIGDALVADGAVVLTGPILDAARATQYLTAVDPVTAELLWTEDVLHVAVLDPETLIVIDREGAIRAIDHASGRTRWEQRAPETAGSWVRREGSWLAAQHADGLRLHDLETGVEVARVGGWLTSSLVPTDSGWLGTMSGLELGLTPEGFYDDRPASMTLTALTSDGEVAWSNELGTIRPWWECCPIRTDPDAGTVTVVDPVRHLVIDLATGELLDVRVTAREDDPASSNPGLSSVHVERPRPDVEVVWHPDGDRVDIRTAHADLVIRGGRGIDVASVDPFIVVDGAYLLGVRTVP